MVITEVQSVSGLRLSVAVTGNKFYLGPAEYIKSNLFETSMKFRLMHRIRRVVSKSVFTNSRIYRLANTETNKKILNEIPTIPADKNLIEIVQTGERAMEWKAGPLLSITSVSSISNINILDSKSSAFTLINGEKNVMFENPQSVFLLEEKTYLEDEGYDIRYYVIPDVVALCIIGSKGIVSGMEKCAFRSFATA